MNNENRKKIIMAVLLVVAVGVVLYQLVFAGGPARPTPKAATTKNAPGAKPAAGAAAAHGAATGEPTTFQEVEVDIDALLKEIEVVNFDYQTAHIDRDPMTPLVGIVPHQAGMETAQLRPSQMDVLNRKVTGIIYDPQSPSAVVDDEVVYEGYVYPDGTVVQDIERDRVVFKIGDSLIPVEMKKLGMGQ